MIGYVTIGANDFEKARGFYDGLLAELGGKRIFASDRMQFYGTGGPGAPMVAVCKPYDGKEASVGNGTMVALAAASRELVDKAYAKAIASGALDEGAPGVRVGNFYGGYFRDPDGNKICVFNM
jgi:catechol 2,3-dioxygenase-like lactoylglutathione lyase family enzyme